MTVRLRESAEFPTEVKEVLAMFGNALAAAARNPRRHAAGKPFHAFLFVWLGWGLDSLGCR